MKFAAAVVSMCLLASPFSMAKAACESEARGVIKRYLGKRGVGIGRYSQLKVQSLTPGSYWQRYNVTALVVTTEGERMSLRFVMTSPFICEDLSIESVH